MGKTTRFHRANVVGGQMRVKRASGDRVLEI
jgi:hypothetical protein